MEQIKTCIDVALSWEQQIEAAKLARKENEENGFNAPTIISDALQAGFNLESMSAVLLTSKKWQNGRKITVAFMDGSTTLRQRVMEKFQAWEPYANLDIVLIDSVADADLRVTFNRGGSWSYVGTDCLLIPDNEPTMQLGWLTDTSGEDELRRVTVHEMGHTLGLGHEHQHPQGGIPWNKEKVYDYYMNGNGWTREDVDQQVFRLMSVSQTNFSVYDPLSIMHYPVPAQLLTDPSRAVGWNTSLSALDKSFAAQAYPKPNEPVKPVGYKPGLRRRAISSIAKWYREEVVGTLNGEDKGHWTPK